MAGLFTGELSLMRKKLSFFFLLPLNSAAIGSVAAILGLDLVLLVHWQCIDGG